MAKGSLESVAGSIAQVVILSELDIATHVKWQRCIRTMFVRTAEDVLKHG